MRLQGQIDHWASEPDLPRLDWAVQTRERDPIEALTQFKALASAGSPMSMIYIGHSYQEGIGTEKDLIEAESWYRRAADAGSIMGFHALGRLHIVQERYNEAREAFRFAATAGYSPAINYLGRMYYFGWGVEKDIARAKVFLEDAAVRGNVWAKRLLGKLLVETHPSATELVRGVFLTVRAYIDVLIVLCVEGMSSDKLTR